MRIETEQDPSASARLKIHLIGVGGCGMKGLAGYFLTRGQRVSGSDLRIGPDVQSLRRLGAQLCEGHATANLPADVDLVIVSRAIPDDNPEVLEARRLGIPVETYSQGLGRLLRAHDGTTIGVSGTHGKTTTSAWLALILKLGGRDPSFVIGGDGQDFGGNIGVGAGAEFVVEACEYGGSFLDLRPNIGVIINVEDDHQECYGGPRGVMDAFGKFARTVPPSGRLIVNRDLLTVVREWGVTAQVIPVGPSPNQNVHENGFCGKGYWLEKASHGAWILMKDSEPLIDVRVRVPGSFNRQNLLFAAATALEVGVAPEALQNAARDFRGVRRRFQEMGTFRGVTVIDDYAHHPTEIKAVLGAARDTFEGRPIKVVFEPHQFRRLQNYLGAFGEELARADEVIVCDVDAARERPDDWLDVSPDALVDLIRDKGVDARFLPLERVVGEVVSELARGDVVMTLGAGRAGEIADGLVRELR